MPSDHDNQTGISRRDFASRLGAAAAGVALGGEFFRPGLQAAPHVSGRILGANDKVVVASIGVHGQGNAVKRGFAQLANVEIKTLCDVDANLAPERINDPRLKNVAHVQAGVRPGPAGGSWTTRTSTPSSSPRPITGTRSPPSGPFRPASTCTSRSRRRTPCGKDGRWSRRRPVQQGGAGRHEQPQQRRRSARRSSSSTTAASARCTWRGASASSRGPSIGKYPDGPMAPGEKFALNVMASPEPVTYDAEYLSKVDYDLWLGPRRSSRSTATAFTTTGTGTGTSATATPATRDRTSSTSRAGAWASRNTRSASDRWAAISDPNPRRKRPTCRRRSTSTRTERSWSSARAASSRTTKTA